jgi:hypothetical protein
MTELFDIQFNWWQLLKAAAWLALVYFLLNRLTRWLAFGQAGRLQLSAAWRRRIQAAASLVLTLFEPAAVLLLVGIFIFINPGLHGLIALLLLVAGFSSLRNYINGRILLLNNTMMTAHRLATGGETGLIARRGRLGLYLRVHEGLRYIPYTALIEQGYTLLAGEDVGRLFHMRLTPSPNTTVSRLPALLASTPYLDRNQIPELKPLPGGGYEANLLLRDESYLPDLIQLIREWGWTCEPFNADTWKS